MCGIAGRIAYPHEMRPDVEGLVREMMRRLQHRGPDDSGYWRDRCAALGHRRLSIIDLSPSGHQPMVGEDGKTVLVFNGEIYNYRELREQFSGDIRFRFHNDSEVILKLYEKFGSDCLSYFRGMFAFAIWDSAQQQLFFARDRFGKKPFFYSVQNNVMAFASELHALRGNPDFRFEIDEEAISRYLSLQYVPSPLSIYRNVFKLPPAHYGIFRNGAVTIQRYWQLDHNERPWTEPEALEKLDELLAESVRLRMISDVPLGAFLSGGIDSSAVVALMSRLSAKPVKTFSIRFEEEAFNEAAFARKVAAHCGTEHQEFSVRPNYIEILPKLLCHYSEPFADPSALPVYYLSKMTRSHVTVALTGDGGDEAFGGYPRYLLPAPTRTTLLAPAGPAASVIPANMRYLWRMRRFVENRTQSLPYNYIGRIGFFQESEKERLLTREFRAKITRSGTLRWFEQQFERFRGIAYPQNLMAVDIETYLADDLLVKTDIAAMFCSLEARCPFLDHKLMEFAASLPVALKISNGDSKYLLKKYLKGMLPDHILARPKMGFGVPIKHWFRHQLSGYLEDVLLSPAATGRGYFQPKIVEKLIRRHRSGFYDYSYQLYALLVLELWNREVA